MISDWLYGGERVSISFHLFVGVLLFIAGGMYGCKDEPVGYTPDSGSLTSTDFSSFTSSKLAGVFEAFEWRFEHYDEQGGNQVEQTRPLIAEFLDVNGIYAQAGIVQFDETEVEPLLSGTGYVGVMPANFEFDGGIHQFQGGAGEIPSFDNSVAALNGETVVVYPTCLDTISMSEAFTVVWEPNHADTVLVFLMGRKFDSAFSEVSTFVPNTGSWEVDPLLLADFIPGVFRLGIVRYNYKKVHGDDGRELILAIHSGHFVYTTLVQ